MYLKSIVLDKFKSFKHAELFFSKGFTCVVGPNGSGKSVIFDSLMFGLGEPSLQTLRVDHLEELINRNVKRKADEPTVAHIKMEFEGESGEQITVIKGVRSDSKTSYKLNGKATTRKEVIEVLSKGGVRVDDTTTIAQGEITSIASMNSNERRELIDTASGIRDFERKKDEAMKELDKVDQKISEANIMLNERKGFLDELEKEKEAAESYMKMNQRLKALRYSILVARQAELKSTFDSNSKEIAALESKKGESSKKMTDLGAKRDILNGERQGLTQELNKITSTSGETTSKLENLSRELAKLEVEMPALQKSIEESNAFIDQSNADISTSKGKIKENKSAMEAIAKKVAELEKELEKMGIIPEGVDFDKELRSLDTEIFEYENRLVDVQGYISKLQAEVSMAASKKAEADKQMFEIVQGGDVFKGRKKAKETELADAKKKIADIITIIARLDVERGKLGKRIFEIDGEMLNLKEQRAIAQSREGSLTAKLSDKFGEKDGFYGKASKLCRYESKYAYAVEVAASNRFEYFVVDNMASANKIIDYLKKNSLGRATFIPINELNVDRQTQKDKDMTAVMEVIKFDSKFSKVFSYIFNNTYIIDKPEDSKKYGIGRHRYVTLEGELIETSGTISGGSVKRISLTAIEGRIRELDLERQTVKKNADLTEVGLKEAEKEKALLDMQVQNVNEALKSINEEIQKLSMQQRDIEGRIASAQAAETKMGKDIVAKDKEKLEIVSEVESKKAARNALYEKFTAMSKGFGKSAKFKEEKAKSEKLRDEMEANRVRSAELNKEVQLTEQRLAELEKAVSERHKQVKERKAELSDKEIRKEVLAKSKSGIEQEIKSKNDSSKKAYDRLSSIEAEISKLSAEYGKHDAEVSNYDRQINEIRLKGSQTETRLHDITAELVSYEKGIELVKGRTDEMETEASVLVVKIGALGNVNLKAPEIFDEKKRLADEAQSKVGTLQTEKDAVLRMIEEIDSKKLQTFMEMLNEVNKNFGKLYNYVFPGKASIMLEDDKDPLNSGLHIKMMDGKTEIPLKGMSGGQKSMIALMLLFSIHMCKKSSLYLFDEVDAALDAENAKLLSKLVKEMSKDAQFVVISHNNSLIVNADTAIGVTMDDRKESTAVGLEIASLIKSKPQ